jgi:hypothetical protein
MYVDIYEILLQTFHNYCSASITVCLHWVLGLLPSGKVLTTHPYPMPGLKKEHSLTLPPSPPCPHGLFYSELDLLNPASLVQDTVI